MRHVLALTLPFPLLALAQPAPTTKPSPPGVGRFPHIAVDLPNKEIRIDCESLNPTMPLEFLCVLTGTSEHESVLRSQAKPSHLHTALLMLGAQPGRNAKYDEAQEKWLPPTGHPIDLSLELPAKDNQPPKRLPASSLIRDLDTKQSPKSLPFVFAGSRTMPDGNYAADTTGYIASLVNFDLTLLDTPRIASSANDTLQYEFNPDTVPPTGTKVTLILRLATPTTQPTR
jgi:hypothetical protein